MSISVLLRTVYIFSKHSPIIWVVLRLQHNVKSPSCLHWTPPVPRHLEQIMLPPLICEQDNNGTSLRKFLWTLKKLILVMHSAVAGICSSKKYLRKTGEQKRRSSEGTSYWIPKWPTPTVWTGLGHRMEAHGRERFSLTAGIRLGTRSAPNGWKPESLWLTA